MTVSDSWLAVGGSLGSSAQTLSEGTDYPVFPDCSQSALRAQLLVSEMKGPPRGLGVLERPHSPHSSVQSPVLQMPSCDRDLGPREGGPEPRGPGRIPRDKIGN